ncbi:Gp37-like protein [Prescottella equi]|uniref:Gp37-like protein n=1 Tax=Rhodococcus hoagii TaxID=43767 RepID=UPI0007CD5270|nr:hypothetical protein [Prescottella equi]
MTTGFTAPSVEELEAIWNRGTAIREDHKALRRTPPLVRLWANDPADEKGLILRGSAQDSVAGQFPFKKKGASTGTLRLRIDHYLARWMMSIPNDSAAKKNVVISVDHMGGAMRWSGLLKNWTIRKDRDGIRYLEATFIDDLQFLQYLHGAPNPLLPLWLFQFPRVFNVLGPSRWCVALLIWMNLARFQSNIYNVPDDPFQLGSWIDGWNMNTWQVLIKGVSFLGDSSLWTILSSRMDKVESAIEDALDDAQLVLTYRRVFTVDGETVDGVVGVTNPRNGVLVLEVVDRSGYFGADGTATRGTALHGFVRTAVEFAEGFVEQADVFVSEDQSLFPPEYYWENWLGIKPSHPCFVVRDSEYTQTEAAELSWGPAGPVQIIVGGENEYADSAVELAIQVTGNLLGYFMLGGFSSAGDIAATVIMPLLRGTILAWNSWKSTSRAQQLGWVHLMEMYQQGANNAWTLSAAAALRAGFEATKATGSGRMDMRDGEPFLPGLHIRPGDRIGQTIQGMTGSVTTDPVFVNQVELMTLGWDYANDTPHGWEIAAGTNKSVLSAAERSARLLSKLLSSVQNQGVSIV